MTAPSRPGARHIQLELQVLDGGRIRVSTPQAVGHADVVRGPQQLWGAVERAFREATIAGYARWQGVPYDQEVLTDESDDGEPAWKRSARRSGVGQGGRLPVSYSSRSLVRPDQANPGDWEPLEDGRWRAPSGRVYRPDTRYVRGVVSKRALLGLPVTFDEAQGRAAG